MKTVGNIILGKEIAPPVHGNITIHGLSFRFYWDKSFLNDAAMILTSSSMDIRRLWTISIQEAMALVAQDLSKNIKESVSQYLGETEIVLLTDAEVHEFLKLPLNGGNALKLAESSFDIKTFGPLTYYDDWYLTEMDDYTLEQLDGLEVEEPSRLL